MHFTDFMNLFIISGYRRKIIHAHNVCVIWNICFQICSCVVANVYIWNRSNEYTSQWCTCIDTALHRCALDIFYCWRGAASNVYASLAGTMHSFTCHPKHPFGHSREADFSDMHPWCPVTTAVMRTFRIYRCKIWTVISLHGCAGRSESLPIAHAQRSVFS